MPALPKLHRHFGSAFYQRSANRLIRSRLRNNSYLPASADQYRTEINQKGVRATGWRRGESCVDDNDVHSNRIARRVQACEASMRFKDPLKDEVTIPFRRSLLTNGALAAQINHFALNRGRESCKAARNIFVIPAPNNPAAISSTPAWPSASADINRFSFWCSGERSKADTFRRIVKIPRRYRS